MPAQALAAELGELAHERPCRRGRCRCESRRGSSSRLGWPSSQMTSKLRRHSASRRRANPGHGSRLRGSGRGGRVRLSLPRRRAGGGLGGGRLRPASSCGEPRRNQLSAGLQPGDVLHAGFYAAAAWNPEGALDLPRTPKLPGPSPRVERATCPFRAEGGGRPNLLPRRFQSSASSPFRRAGSPTVQAGSLCSPSPFRSSNSPAVFIPCGRFCGVNAALRGCARMRSQEEKRLSENCPAA